MAQEACHILPYHNLLLLVIGRGCSRLPLVAVLCHRTAQTLASGAGSQTVEVDRGMEEAAVCIRKPKGYQSQKLHQR